MSESDENNISFELTASQDDTRFLVHNHLEILRILRGLAHRHELVSAFFNAGKELLLTSVLDVDADHKHVLLDCGSNEDFNKRILHAERIIFVASLDGVKIQFVSHSIVPAAFEGRDAFSIPMPEEVLRLQRREYYRLATPIVNPILCMVPLGDGRTLEVPLVDISAGGIGIVISNLSDMPIEAHTVYPGCRISLPGVGTVEATLRVQGIFEVTLKNGSKSLRAGCQFVDMRPAMQAVVQRYIIKLERERIANAPPAH